MSLTVCLWGQSACVHRLSTSKRISQAAYMHGSVVWLGLCSWPALACSSTDCVRHNIIVNGHLLTAHCSLAAWHPGRQRLYHLLVH